MYLDRTDTRQLQDGVKATEYKVYGQGGCSDGAVTTQSTSSRAYLVLHSQQELFLLGKFVLLEGFLLTMGRALLERDSGRLLGAPTQSWGPTSWPQRAVGTPALYMWTAHTSWGCWQVILHGNYDCEGMQGSHCAGDQN